MLTASTKDGIVRRMVYNENVILTNGDDELHFTVRDDKLDFQITINIVFSNEGEQLKTTGDFNAERGSMDLTLHKWNEPLGSEVVAPIELKLTNEKRIWIKFRTWATSKNNFRSFHLTVWGEE